MEDKPVPETTEPEQLEVMYRSASMAVAVAVAPTAGVVANHLLNRPEGEPPKKIELPPGVERPDTED